MTKDERANRPAARFETTRRGHCIARTISIATSTDNQKHVHASVEMGSTRLPDVPASIHTHDIFPGEAGLIGSGILSKFTVTLDAEKGRLILAKRN